MSVSYETTTLQKKVYVTLLNCNNPRFPHTATEVCRLLDIPKTTCSDAIHKLVSLGFITPITSDRSNVLYRKGTNAKIIETYISAEFFANSTWFDAYGHAIAPKPSAKPYHPTFRAHVNGSWLQFPVATEGQIAEFAVRTGDKMTTRALFGKASPSKTPGSDNYYAKFLLNDVWFSIRYQRTTKNRWFYVQAPSMVETADQVTPDADLQPQFVSSVTPLLAFLEKWAGWRFKHTETGGYEVKCTFKQGSSRGGQKEYGFDDFSSNLIKEYLGEDTGIIGQSPYWSDNSPGAQGERGEFETSKADYVTSFDSLPKTTATVKLLMDTNARLLQEVHTLQQIVETLIFAQETVAEAVGAHRPAAGHIEAMQ